MLHRQKTPLLAPLLWTCVLAALSACQMADASQFIIDERDPDLQKATEHLASAQQALARAQSELALAQDAYHLPGLNYAAMNAQLEPVEDTLRVLLSPNRKRHAHQTVVPDGIFFTPVKIGE
tara:strand:+ start:9408 stop:9773 length:366 start_codon:yes stop_codon:yes gene_type:complete